MTSDQEFQKLLDKGDAHGKAKQQREQLACWEQALKIKPDEAPLLLRISAIYLLEKQFTPALARLRHYVELVPHNTLGWDMQKNAIYELHCTDEQLVWLGHYLQAHPKAAAWLRRAILLGANGRFQDALESVTRSTTLVPHYADAWYIKGNILLGLSERPRSPE